MKSLHVILAAAAAVAALAPGAPTARPTAIRFGLLIDGQGAALTDAVVVVDGDRITRIVTPGDIPPEAAVIIDTLTELPEALRRG